MKTHSDAEKMLMQIGFTQLESEIYLYLLMKGSHTGYAIAKGIGKAVANVYKAVESLATKGAIDQSSGSSKQCVAVPWQQLLTSETAKFNANMSSLSESLRRIPEPQDDEQVYQIKNVTQLRERAVRIIEQATHVVLATIDPSAVEWVKQPLIEAAERGVEVIVKVYEEVDMPGVRVITRKNGKQVYAKTLDVSLSICADGKEMLKGLLNADKTHIIQAFKSKSALMTLMLYNQLLYEMVLTELKEVIPKGNIKKAQQILEDTEHLHVFSSENSVFDNFEQTYKTKRD